MRPLWKKITDQLGAALEVPGAVLADQATINLIGTNQARILNHKGLVRYTTECVKARSVQGSLEVEGRNLQIISFSFHEIKVIGEIYRVVLR